MLSGLCGGRCGFIASISLGRSLMGCSFFTSWLLSFEACEKLLWIAHWAVGWFRKHASHCSEYAFMPLKNEAGNSTAGFFFNYFLLLFFFSGINLCMMFLLLIAADTRSWKISHYVILSMHEKLAEACVRLKRTCCDLSLCSWEVIVKVLWNV